MVMAKRVFQIPTVVDQMAYHRVEQGAGLQSCLSALPLAQGETVPSLNHRIIGWHGLDGTLKII